MQIFQLTPPLAQGQDFISCVTWRETQALGYRAWQVPQAAPASAHTLLAFNFWPLGFFFMFCEFNDAFKILLIIFFSSISRCFVAKKFLDYSPTLLVSS